MDAKITIPEDAVTAAVHKAILESLDEDTRVNIISQAITWLNTAGERQGYYGMRDKANTPLQDAFQIAMRQATMTVVDDMIRNDEEVRTFVQNELRTMVADFSRQMDSASVHELRSVIIEAMVNHLAEQKNNGY